MPAVYYIILGGIIGTFYSRGVFLRKNQVKAVTEVFYAPVLVSLVVIGIFVFDPHSSDWLRYQRVSIGNGEYWRLITGHLCHLGELHLLFNVLGMWLVTFLLFDVLRGYRWFLIFGFCVLGTSLGLWYFSPEVIRYVGLSGALHGLVVAGGILDLRNLVLNNAVLLGGVFGKIIWEHSSYYDNAMSELIGGHVLVDSHMYGAIAGVVIGVAIGLKDHLAKQINHG